MNVEQQLINRYITLIKISKPGIESLKNEDGGLDLNHLLWMLEKMSSPSFVPKTSNKHWLGWVQAGLYNHRLIHIKHEKDITRELFKQQESLNAVT